MTALWTPPALSKAQGKLRSPAPRADFSMMKMAPMEPSRGPAVTSSGGLAEAEASRLMLSLANSSMRHRRETHDGTHGTGYIHKYIHTPTGGAGQLPTTPEARTVLCGQRAGGCSLSKVSRVEGGWGAGLMEGGCCLEVVLEN